jgi:3D (Asp-Asp-Asp) domain-containing protein
MKKFITYLVAGLSIASYGFPALVAKAGTDLPAFSLAQNPSPMAESLELRVTAYASVPAETDSTPFITANGTYVHDGIVATNLLPFGTKVQIPALFGTKIFTVEDRMNKHESHGLDIWMPTVGQAIVFGVHYAQIVILPNQDLSMR